MFATCNIEIEEMNDDEKEVKITIRPKRDDKIVEVPQHINSIFGKLDFANQNRRKKSFDKHCKNCDTRLWFPIPTLIMLGFSVTMFVFFRENLQLFDKECNLLIEKISSGTCSLLGEILKVTDCDPLPNNISLTDECREIYNIYDKAGSDATGFFYGGLFSAFVFVILFIITFCDAFNLDFEDRFELRLPDVLSEDDLDLLQSYDIHSNVTLNGMMDNIKKPMEFSLTAKKVFPPEIWGIIHGYLTSQKTKEFDMDVIHRNLFNEYKFIELLDSKAFLENIKSLKNEKYVLANNFWEFRKNDNIYEEKFYAEALSYGQQFLRLSSIMKFYKKICEGRLEQLDKDKRLCFRDALSTINSINGTAERLFSCAKDICKKIKNIPAEEIDAIEVAKYASISLK